LVFCFCFLFSQDLHALPEFNGMTGIVEQRAGNRWIIRLNDSNRTVSVKAANLDLVHAETRSQSQSLAARNSDEPKGLLFVESKI
jgi:hypothetical protein